MENITLEKLLDEVRKYNPSEVDIIKKAYDYAKTLHDGQYRQSGEPYIIHPLNVAYILAEMHADKERLLKKSLKLKLIFRIYFLFISFLINLIKIA